MEYQLMAKPDRKPPKKGKRSLRGKGPTPRAEDRPYHKKFKSKEENQRKRTERKRIDAKRSDRKRDYRRDPKDHVDTVAGRNAVVEALRAVIPAKELVVAVGVDVDERLNESIRLSQKMGIGIREVERRQIENMTGIANHQGVALIVKPFQYSSQKEIFARAKEPALFVAVDGVTDPRNIGAIARSAAAFSADGVRIPGVSEFLPVRRGLRMGETLTLGIRPEFVECVPAGTAGSLPARVVAARNMGTHWLIDCQLGEHRIAAKQRALHAVNAGDSVGVKLPDERILYYVNERRVA